jgi:hypothetical protein
VAPALFWHGGGRSRPCGPAGYWADWAKVSENSFQNKIRFLNLHRLRKFV